MSTKYKCIKCGNFETCIFSYMKKHIDRKNSCIKLPECMILSDDQILVSTLIPYCNNIQQITNNDILHLENSNIIYKNKNELFNEIDRIEKNKIKCCKYCNEEFSLIFLLKKHIIIKCFYMELLNRKKNLENNSTEFASSSSSFGKNVEENTNFNNGIQNSIYNNCENINNTNIQTLNNNNNNISFFIGVNNPVPFDDEWDLSKIDESKKAKIFISQTMYTNFLKEILNNEINLNVVMDKENNDYCMVYKNNIDKYIQMKSKDIVEDTMKKLNCQLLYINKNDTNSFDEIIEFSRRMINKKYIDYQKNENIHKGVDNLICSIYDNKRSDALNVAKKVLKNKDKIKMNGF